MECTAQAFEEMQEQNIRLLQQLKVVGKGGGVRGGEDRRGGRGVEGRIEGEGVRERRIGRGGEVKESILHISILPVIC